MVALIHIQKPHALRAGDWVGLAAPSSPFDHGALEQGSLFLENLGFRLRYVPGFLSRRRGFLAGEDCERAEELRVLFEDAQVRAIFAARGGYGAMRILNRLDPAVIRRNPKLLVGYSDLTCILSFLLDVCNLVCIHGPVVTEMGTLSARSRRHLHRCLTRASPIGPVPLRRPRWIRKGRVKAPLVGGNLSVISATIGTPWAMQTEGRILFLEDRGEKPYQVDRMLVQLRQAGKLSSIAGLLFGDVLEQTGSDHPLRGRKAMEEVLYENTRDLGVPVVCGLPVGHGKENLALPLGVLAEINGTQETFSIVEPAVRERA